MRAIISTILVAAIVPTAASGTGAAERARPGGPPTFAQLRWAREELDAVLGSAVPVRVVGSSGSNGSSESLTCGVSLWRETLAHPRVTLLQLPGAAPLESRGDAPPQSFSLRCAAHAGCTRCVVVGADGAGLMYGVSRLLDEARVGAAVVDRNGSGRLRLLPQLPSEPVAVDQGAPYIIFRGLKLNAPIDARTPSYADCGDSAQANMATMWDPSFWPEYFAAMVRMRYNVLSIWQPHPYPSLTRVPEYPGVGWPDVMRGDSVDWLAFAYECTTSNSGLSPTVQRHLAALRTMTLDDKIAFFSNVTAQAAALGIDVHVMTWSVFTAFAGHGMGGDATNETATYLRAAVRAFLKTYPDVVGIGVTAGENMTGADAAKEAWVWAAHGLAVNDVVAADPSRRIVLTHRVWETDLAAIDAAFAGLDPAVQFDYAFKYCAGRCYATDSPLVWAQANLTIPAGSPSRFWWTLRNDDVYSMRWANVSFIRALVLGLPGSDVTRGWWLGSDGWVWGREFVSLAPRAPSRQLEIDKHWLTHTAWALLSYDPATPEATFAALAAAAYPEAPSGTYMLELAAVASATIPAVDQFYWQMWDYQWNPETCAEAATDATGMTTVNITAFVYATPLKQSGLLSVMDWARGVGVGTSPLAHASAMAASATTAIASASAVAPGDNRALTEALGDYAALGHLGLYYSSKIRAAAAVGVYLVSDNRNATAKTAAIAHLQNASRSWTAYADTLYAIYAPQVIHARTGAANLRDRQIAVDRDVDIVKALP